MILAIMLVHFGWIILLVGGTIYIYFNPAYVQWHLTLVTLTLLLNLFLGACPLTSWEERVREWGDNQIDYKGSFAATYVHRIFGVDLSEKQIMILMTGIKVVSYLSAVFISI